MRHFQQSRRRQKIPVSACAFDGSICRSSCALSSLFPFPRSNSRRRPSRPPYSRIRVEALPKDGRVVAAVDKIPEAICAQRPQQIRTRAFVKLLPFPSIRPKSSLRPHGLNNHRPPDASKSRKLAGMHDDRIRCDVGPGRSTASRLSLCIPRKGG